MEVSVEGHKIILYGTAYFYFEWRCWWRVGEVAVNRKNYQGCQFDEYFIQRQTSTDILGIVNDFVYCDQNYFQYLNIPI